MTHDVAIRAEGLGKRYVIGHRHERERYVALRDVLARSVKGVLRTGGDLLRGRGLVQGDEREDFWALRDLDFEIMRGDVVGIVGRNGAGKSTLLKILSRITEPSEGRVTIAGKVASLLEVGTGFHPELTGRENIFLNGAVLGMSQRETRRKFDEIVAFAGIERFLDTPVKRYSSGMYVRLAFAVAAHLEPDILIVDEVLAVGDAEFQKKCLGKMSEVAGGGRTVLFVSHSMGAVTTLCEKAILLNQGRLEAIGPVGEVVARYMHSAEDALRADFVPSAARPSIRSIQLDGEALARGDLRMEIEFVSPFALSPAVGGVILNAPNGQPVWGSSGRFHPASAPSSPLDRGVLVCESSNLPLAPGRYTLSAWLSSWHEDYESRPDAISFSFREDETQSARPSSEVSGHLDWPAAWTVRGEG